MIKLIAIGFFPISLIMIGVCLHFYKSYRICSDIDYIIAAIGVMCLSMIISIVSFIMPFTIWFS
jgi:hypothetical protein